MCWGFEDAEVSVNNVEDIHELSLVLVYSFDLDIVHCVEWDVESCALLNPLLKSFLVVFLDLDKSLLEVRVISIWSQLSQVLKESNPLINASKGLTEQVRKLWIAAMDPSSWSDTIGLVLKLVWIQLIEFLKDGFLQELTMQSSHTVDSVRAHDGQVGHSNFLGITFFNQTHSCDLCFITWILLFESLNVQMVDQVNNLQMSWQQFANKVNRPLFECLWQDSMVGVGEDLVHDTPCLVEGELLLID